MAGEPVLTFTGNVGRAPETRDVNGKTVANFTVAVTPRVKDGQNYKDGETIWFECAAWGYLADNVAETVSRGDKVLVVGRLKEIRNWESNGKSGTTIRVDVDEVGQRVPPYPVSNQRQQAQEQPQDPWATPGNYNDETPF